MEHMHSDTVDVHFPLVSGNKTDKMDVCIVRNGWKYFAFFIPCFPKYFLHV